MSFEWKTVKLGDIAEIVGGGTPSTNIKEYFEGNIAWITPRDLTNYNSRFIKKGERNITELGLKNSSAKLMPKGTVLLTSRAPIGYVVIAENEVCTNQGFKSFIVNKLKITNDFLYYLLKTNVDYLKSLGTGTTFAEISASTLRNLEFQIPPLSIQQKIAEILSSLDDKIELNRQMNSTLETMAQTLFKEWFVKPITEGVLPDGWREEVFENIMDAERGLSYKGSGLADESTGIPMQNLNSVYEGGSYKYEGIKYYSGDFKEKHTIKPNDVIVTNTEQGHKYMLIGYPAIVPEKYERSIFSHHIYRLRPKTDSYLTSDYIYHLLLQPEIREQIVGFANGTTVNMLKIQGLQKPIFKLPPQYLIEKFTDISKNMRLKQQKNIQEIQTLKQLRDSLLPKLLRGDIVV